MAKKPKEPPFRDAERCLRLRKQSKRGFNNSSEDVSFCQEMWRKYPAWYTNTEAEVFNDTVPFGSTVRMETTKPKETP